MTFLELGGYRKDLRRLLKKYKSLLEDVIILKQVLVCIPDEIPASGFLAGHSLDLPEIIKVRKVACKSLKGTGVNSGLCLMYSRQENEKKIVMIGLFDRNVQENKDFKSMARRFDLYSKRINRGRP